MKWVDAKETHPPKDCILKLSNGMIISTFNHRHFDKNGSFFSFDFDVCVSDDLSVLVSLDDDDYYEGKCYEKELRTDREPLKVVKWIYFNDFDEMVRGLDDVASI